MQGEERPIALPVQHSEIDQKLKQCHQWITWRYEKRGKKFTKVPYQPSGIPASTTKPETWSSFDDVTDPFAVGDKGFDGIGFVFSPDDGLVGIDIDDCIDADGNWNELATKTVEEVGGFIELSPSGRGLHIITESELAKAHVDHDIGLEIYDRGRYFTVSGHPVNGHRAVQPSDLTSLIDRHFGSDNQITAPAGASLENYKAPADMTDEQVRAMLKLLDPDGSGYGGWLEVGMALHHQYGGGYLGMEIWDEWSQRSQDYDEQEIERKWPSFASTLDRTPVTLATVIKRAKDARDLLVEKKKEKAGEAQAAQLEAETLPDLDFMSIPQREWVLGNRLLGSYITATFAPGGVSKSTFSLVSAVAVATGRDLTGEGLRKRGPVWVINDEDDEIEIQRRLAGISILFSIPWSEIRANVYVTSGYGHPYLIARRDKDYNIVTTPNVDKIIEEIKRKEIVYLVADPLITMHEGSENDNNEIQKAVDSFKKIASETGVAIELVHHTRKSGGGDSEAHAGDAEAGRGASALKDASRIAVTLARMSKTTAKENEIDWEIGRRLVRLDQGKGNFALPDEQASWFKLHSVAIGNGDEVGVPAPFDFQAASAAKQVKQAAEKAAEIEQWRIDIVGQMTSDRIPMRSKLAPRMEPVWGLKDRAVRDRIPQTLPYDEKNGVEVQLMDSAYRVWLEQDGDDKRGTVYVVREEIES